MSDVKVPSPPDDIRVSWFVEQHHGRDPIAQKDNGRRVCIDPSEVTVNYWLSANGICWYVRIEGQVVKRDGFPGQHRRCVTFWPVHDEVGKRIENAPEWVRSLVAEAHELLNVSRLRSGGSES